MKILFAAEGSKFTKKALAFLVTHESLAGPEDELVVLNVQPPVPPRVKTMVGAATVNAYHRDEAGLRRGQGVHGRIAGIADRAQRGRRVTGCRADGGRNEQRRVRADGGSGQHGPRP